MMDLIQNLPDHVLGIIASGEVPTSDYENVLIPAIEVKQAEHGKLRILYQSGTAFTGFTAGAMWDDLKLGVARLTAWEKVAVVTDVDWVANATRFFGFVMPCPVKVFSNKEIAAAALWVAEA